MYKARFRFTLVATTAVLTLVLSLCLTGTVGASPMTTQPKAHPNGKSIGQQSHGSSVSTAGAASTVYCDIWDLTHISGQNFYPQVEVTCPLPATITVDVYVQYCSYWNVSEHFCAGTWSRGGGGLHCYGSGYGLVCPNPALAIPIASGKAVRGDFVVSTTIPNSVPPTVTGEYYGAPYLF
jgi:hypothetical protein